MTDPAQRAEQDIVWSWANQFPYKLNISDDKIESLSRQVKDALRTVERETWEAADERIECLEQMNTCYRLGTRPTQKQLDRWDVARETWEAVRRRSRATGKGEG